MKLCVSFFMFKDRSPLPKPQHPDTRSLHARTCTHALEIGTNDSFFCVEKKKTASLSLVTFEVVLNPYANVYFLLNNCKCVCVCVLAINRVLGERSVNK